MHSEVNLLSVDNETVHPCWIRCNDTGSSDILPTKYKTCYITRPQTKATVMVWAV